MEAYQNYLEKLYGLVTKRLLLGALRSDKKASHTVPVTEDGIETDPGNRSAREKELIDEVRSEARALYDTEETLLSGDSFAPLPYLYAACNADDFERHAAAMLLFSEISAACADGIHVIMEGSAGMPLSEMSQVVTPRLLKLTYEGEYHDDLAYLSLREDSVFGSIFLEKTDERGMNRALHLNEKVLRMILTGSPVNMDTKGLLLAKGYAFAGAPIPHTQLMTGGAGLSDVIMPEHSRDQVAACIERVRLKETVYDTWGFSKNTTYGRGVSMLFWGPPGTGKTMLAQAVANELGMELYRVNLPAVVSKYVGETEKNLNEIFEHAKGRHIVLFFDEADVLFGKRTEIKEANDKYSNMEAAYLLQRMEEYEGVTVLATNYRRNFDEAFSRRLTAIIAIPFPDVESRKEIWDHVLPKERRGEDIDIDQLAEKYELTGSSIKNSVLSAAFASAAAGEERISGDTLAAGIRGEFEKQGKTVQKD